MSEKSQFRRVKLILLIAAGTILALIAHFLFLDQRIITWTLYGIVVLLVLWAILLTYLEPARKPTERKDIVDIFIKIASSVLLIVSLGIAWYSLRLTQFETSKNLELSQTTLENSRIEQRNQRFTEALEKLGGTPHEQLAGIQGFLKLDAEFRSNEEFYESFYNNWKDSFVINATEVLANLEEKRKADTKEHSQIMDILTNYVRMQAQWKGKPEQDAPPPKDEIKTVLRYLAERKLTYGHGETAALDLSNANLSSYRLERTLNTNCDASDAKKVNFEGTNFGNSNLSGIQLQCAKLRKAVFWNANLRGANFQNADLTGADFTGAYLEGTDLTGAAVGQADMSAAFVDQTTRCPSTYKTETACADVSKPETCKCVRE